MPSLKLYPVCSAFINILSNVLCLHQNCIRCALPSSKLYRYPVLCNAFVIVILMDSALKQKFLQCEAFSILNFLTFVLFCICRVINYEAGIVGTKIIDKPPVSTPRRHLLGKLRISAPKLLIYFRTRNL